MKEKNIQLVIGSSMWRTRSAQFGVYDLTLKTVRDYYGPTSENDKKKIPHSKWQ